MEIHELNSKSLTTPAYMALDDGTDTYKADLQNVIDDLEDYADAVGTTLQTQIGDLANLDTTAKNNLVAAINEAAQSGGGGGGGADPYTSNPAELGIASPGSSSKYSRGDHVHPIPSAADLGVIAAPSSPSSGDFLTYNGSSWVATSLSTWQGGSY